jgi:predicted regulator of Ras-like GTPase activity (Roadblock/LC7/MglB family)
MIDDASMALKEICEEWMVRVPGVVACVVMGSDGIAVESVENPDVPWDLSTLIVEYGSAFLSLRKTEESTVPTDEMFECTVSTGQLTALFHWLTPDFFLAVVLKPEGYLGQARFLASVQHPVLVKELS